MRRVNYDENLWFPPELEAERAYLERVDPDAYAHVWLGECRNRSDAQVLMGKWTVDVFEPEPTWNGPYYGADWGFAQDPTAAGCAAGSAGARSSSTTRRGASRSRSTTRQRCSIRCQERLERR
ncbi:MAG: hypothetical protein MZV65_32035 [Chromatiales bacterium]|nr:hypothetical protein [Chromatiales bacterium]